MATDLYSVLGVARSASDADIQKAYRKLARQYHPDRNPGDKQAEAKFKEVQSAFDVLGDKTKRAEYDEYGTIGGAGPGGPGPGPGGFHFRAGGPGGVNFDSADAERVFRQFFGGGGGEFGGFEGQSPFGGGKRRRSPEPQEAEIAVPLDTALAGGTLQLRVGGQEVSVKIPAGIGDGQALRLAGQAPGGGDLLLRVKLQTHDHYALEDGNLIVNVPISIAEAVLGGTVDVPLPDGTRAAVKIPPGTSSGAKLRLRGKGVKGGDCFVRLRVMVPAKPSDKAKELIQEFAGEQPENPRSDPFWHS